MQISLKGKSALVTGASGGIGSAIAGVLVEAGANVVLSGTRQGRLNELKDELAGGGGCVATVPCNLGRKAEIQSLIEQSVKAFGTIDILVNNAGITQDNLFLRMSESQVEEVMNVNLVAAMLLTKGLIRSMIKGRFGRIVNITSVVGHTGNAGQVNYTASKAGMVGFTKSLAQEVAARGVTVNCLAPGFIATEMTGKLTQDQRTAIASTIPMNRIGQPEDVASGVLFLASDQASYITGQTLHINGGLAMI